MASDNRPARGRAKKADRKPIFERLQPFAPWDQRAATALLDDDAAIQRAGELAAGAKALGEAADVLADSASSPAVSASLRHLSDVACWQAETWIGELSGAEGVSSRLAPACASIDPSDELLAVAILGRVILPHLLADAVLFRAQSGEELPAGRSRWLSILIEDLEEQRAEMELMTQAALTGPDVERVAQACGEVAKTV